MNNGGFADLIELAVYCNVDKKTIVKCLCVFTRFSIVLFNKNNKHSKISSVPYESIRIIEQWSHGKETLESIDNIGYRVVDLNYAGNVSSAEQFINRAIAYTIEFAIKEHVYLARLAVSCAMGNERPSSKSMLKISNAVNSIIVKHARENTK